MDTRKALAADPPTPADLFWSSPVIVQWCIKGMALDEDEQAKSLIDSRGGIRCNWWREVRTISSHEIRDKLTDQNLNLHVNHFTVVDPNTKREFRELTPFVSLTAGTVERDAAAKTNIVRRARATALWFGTHFGEFDHAYLYTCWVVVAPRAAVTIEGVAEEVRDLNTYRRYSQFQLEGEMVAKISVPDNQIKDCEKWVWDRSALVFKRAWTQPNPRFTVPEMLTNIRKLILWPGVIWKN
jgi:hypothetical protein